MRMHLLPCAGTLLLGACAKPAAVPQNEASENVAEPTIVEEHHAPAPLGRVTIRKSDEDGGEVLFEGRPLKPAITGNSALDILHTYRYPGKALYVVQDTGGTACPAQLYIVEVTTAGATATDAFGTCSDEIKMAKTAGGLTLTMPGFAGQSEDGTQALSTAADATHAFTYRAGRISERITQKAGQN